MARPQIAIARTHFIVPRFPAPFFLLLLHVKPAPPPKTKFRSPRPAQFRSRLVTANELLWESRNRPGQDRQRIDEEVCAPPLLWVKNGHQQGAFVSQQRSRRAAHFVKSSARQPVARMGKEGSEIGSKKRELGLARLL